MKALLLFLALLTPLLADTRLTVSSNTIHPTTKIEVIFDQAMVEPEAIGKLTPNKLLQISPAWKTQIRWRSQNIATLVVDEAPQIATTYQFALRDGQKSLDGSVIPKQTFKPQQSEPFQVLRNRRTGSVRLGQSVLIFNDDVDPVAAAPFFQYLCPATQTSKEQLVAARTRQATWGDLRSRYDYQPSWQERHLGKNLRYGNPRPEPTTVIKHALVIEPVFPLPLGQKWTLRRLSALPNASGTATIQDIQRYPLGDVSPFEVESIAAITTADLPRRLQVSFNQSLPASMTSEDFLSHLSFADSVTDLKATFDHHRTAVTLTGDFAKRDRYQLTLAKSLTSSERLSLSQPLEKKLKFTRLAPKILLPSHDQAQLARGSRSYQINSINHRSLRLRIKHLSQPDLIRASLGYRRYTGNGPNQKRFKNRSSLPFELIGGQVVEDREILIKAPLDTTHTHRFDWSQYLPEGQLGGAFFVSVTGSAVAHPDLKNAAERETQALVQLTDLGLAWKLTDDAAFLYAYSCETGKALPEAELALFGEDAAALETARTDQDGTATLPRLSKHRLLRVSHGQNQFVIPFDDSLPTVSMWRFPVNFDWGHAPADRRLADLFMDRNLYRPGETIHLKGIVRHLESDTLQLPTSLKPKLTLTDPMRRVIVDQEITLSTSGSFDFTHTLPATTVGRYHFKLTWPDELAAAAETDNRWEQHNLRGSATFSHYFSVQEFQRNTFELKSSLSQSLAYTLDARYYQGTPVAKGRVRWYLNADPVGFYPAKFRDHLFGNHRGYDSDYWSHYFGYYDGGSSNREGYHSENSETELNDAGKLALQFELPDLPFPSPRRVSLQAEVQDPNNQTLSTAASTKIHSSDFYLGFNRLDQITRVGEEIPFEIIAVTKEGELHRAPVAATLTIEREVNTQTKSKAPNGRIVIKNESSLVPVESRQITLTEGKLSLPFTPTDSGKHLLTLTAQDDAGHPIKTVVSRQVYGSDQYPWAYEAGMRIKLVPEKRRYQPGDTARILVLSPIEGEALITVEHLDVVRKFRTQLTLENPVIEVPLTEKDAPNAFISVLVIKGAADSKRKDPEPQLRLGYCEVAVDPASARLQIDLATHESETRPGEMIEVSGTITDHQGAPVKAAEVTFYAVDEGTLAVMGYRNPDPLTVFHQPRTLSIKNGTSLTNFIPESLNAREFGNKGFIIGGGEDAFAASRAMEEEVKLRTNFNPTATWKPTLLTDSRGQFTARFQAPDTLTRYRLIAVATQGPSRFGSTVGEAIVNKPLMLLPAPPAFAHQGDRLTTQAILQNTTETAGLWKVTLQLDSTTTANRNLMTEVEVPAQGQATVEFEVTFAKTGTAKWKWHAEPVSLAARDLPADLKAQLSDAVETTFAVRYPMPLLRENSFLALTAPNVHADLLADFSPELLAGQGEVTIRFARSRLSEAGGAIDYLLRYPYGCAEQTTSATIPWIAAKNLRHLTPSFQVKTIPEIDAAIQAGANRLLAMQTPDGGIAYWTGDGTASDWASSYAGLGLILCHEAGAEVPQSALDRLAGYLSSSLRGVAQLKTDYEFENYTRSLYVLARLGKAEPNYHSKLLEMTEKLTSPARAFLALAMHTAGQDGAAALLAQPLRKEKATGYWMRHRNSEAMTLLALTTISPETPACEEALTRVLAKRAPSGHWQTTWANAWSILAMGAYAQTHETEQNDIRLLVETSEGPQEIILPADQASHEMTLSLDSATKLIAQANARLYAQINLAAQPKIAPVQPVSKSGLAITRRYERVRADGSTEALTSPKVGDLVKVTLTLAIADEEMRYLAIDDPLPSSLQAINADFASQAGRQRARRNWRISYQETRLDRVLFFVDRAPPSSNLEFTYHARVTHPGQIFVPSTKVEEMYDPSRFALGASQTMTVN